MRRIFKKGFFSKDIIDDNNFIEEKLKVTPFFYFL